MQAVAFDHPWPLHGVAATRRIEQQAAAALAPHALMQRAGLAVARLALAVAPHAGRIWIACGPGNNGGDGFEAAVHLQAWGKPVTVTLAGEPARLPPDAAASWERCRAAGVEVAARAPADWDLCIDALLGIGSSRPLQGALADAVVAMRGGPVLSIDVPSGLSADTGSGATVHATHTLSLLTLKPGLFTGEGRDAAGRIWFDGLGVARTEPPTAWLAGPPPPRERLHASHKGSYGDVAVIGGAPGMAGAAVLAASAALHAGAGRVYLCPLGPAGAVVPAQPEIMVRDASSLDLSRTAVACGCGGGADVAKALPRVLAQAQSLVLDADALNAVAADDALRAALRARADAPGTATVLTPHPLEAARLLSCTTADVQSDRLAAAQALAQRFGAVVVLKGSGTVVGAPGDVPWINPTGNARLATGGTGDVLAGFIAALLAAGMPAPAAARAAVFRHGLAADHWPGGRTLTASALAAAL